MKLETKANIDDEVWYMLNNKPTSSNLMGIQASLSGSEWVVWYKFDGSTNWLEKLESECFLTKQELLNSL